MHNGVDDQCVLPDRSRLITRLMCRGRTIAAYAEGEGEAEEGRFSLHEPVFVTADVEDPVELGVAPEAVAVDEDVEFEGLEGVEVPDPDEPAFMKDAIGGPGNTYWNPGLNTSGTRMPGSVSLYAPGKLTRSLADGAPVWDPPTVSWVQDG